MGVITQISAQKKKGRANIFLDGRFFCGLETVTVAKHGLVVGREIEATELELLQAESEANVAFDKAIGQLAVRMRSKKEIEEFLKKKGYLPQTVQTVLAKLAEYGYVNDVAFAHEMVRSFGGLGKRALEEKLRQKGVDKQIVEEVLVVSDEDEEEKARKLAQKFLRTRANAKNLREKLMRHLAGKGFSFDICAKIAKSETNQMEDEYNED